jgi:hypothetical protein
LFGDMCELYPAIVLIFGFVMLPFASSHHLHF